MVAAGVDMANRSTVLPTAGTELARPAAAPSPPTRAAATGASRLAETTRPAAMATAGPSLLPVSLDSFTCLKVRADHQNPQSPRPATPETGTLPHRRHLHRHRLSLPRPLSPPLPTERMTEVGEPTTASRPGRLVRSRPAPLRLRRTARSRGPRPHPKPVWADGEPPVCLLLHFSSQNIS